MWKQHYFETIITSNDVINIQDAIGKGFGPRYRSYYMGFNANICIRRTNKPHAISNYGPIKSNFDVDFYRQTYCSPETLARI